MTKKNEMNLNIDSENNPKYGDVDIIDLINRVLADMSVEWSGCSVDADEVLRDLTRVATERKNQLIERATK